jgi:hypothetical protein
MSRDNTAPATPLPPAPVVVVPGNRRPNPRAAARPQPASREAQRLAAAILEVLAGVRTPMDAAAALGMGVPRYYLWEQRALSALVAACEPRPVGQGRSLRRQVAVLEKEVARLKQECARQQALVRAAQRTIGLAPPPAPKPVPKPGKAGGKATTKTPRKRRPVVRALKAAAAIRSAPVMEDNTPNSSGAIPAEVLQRTPAEAGAAGIAPATAPAPDA